MYSILNSSSSLPMRKDVSDVPGLLERPTPSPKPPRTGFYNNDSFCSATCSRMGQCRRSRNWPIMKPSPLALRTLAARHPVLGMRHLRNPRAFQWLDTGLESVDACDGPHDVLSQPSPLPPPPTLPSSNLPSRGIRLIRPSIADFKARVCHSKKAKEIGHQ